MSDRLIDNPLYQGMSLKSLLETTDLFQIPGLAMDESGGVKKDAIKKKDGADLYKPTAAFLGPTLWDNTQKMSLEYMDLDEFLSENNIPLELCMSPDSQQAQRVSSPPVSPNRLSGMLMERDASHMRTVVCGSPENLSQQIILRGESPLQFVNPAIIEQREMSPEPDHFRREMSPDHDSFSEDDSSDMPPIRPAPTTSNFVIKVSAKPTVSSVPVNNVPRIWTPRKMVDVDFRVDETDLALATVPGIDFDPRKRAFSADELKPQPMIKKSRKQYVPEDLKDDHYWARRNKNNYAAKRSREARRMKENQIAMRANFLEKENGTLSMELAKCKTELNLLKKRLTMFESTT